MSDQQQVDFEGLACIFEPSQPEQGARLGENVDSAALDRVLYSLNSLPKSEITKAVEGINGDGCADARDTECPPSADMVSDVGLDPQTPSIAPTNSQQNFEKNAEHEPEISRRDPDDKNIDKNFSGSYPKNLGDAFTDAKVGTTPTSPGTDKFSHEGSDLSRQTAVHCRRYSESQVDPAWQASRLGRIAGDPSCPTDHPERLGRDGRVDLAGLSQPESSGDENRSEGGHPLEAVTPQSRLKIFGKIWAKNEAEKSENSQSRALGRRSEDDRASARSVRTKSSRRSRIRSRAPSRCSDEQQSISFTELYAEKCDAELAHRTSEADKKAMLIAAKAQQEAALATASAQQKIAVAEVEKQAVTARAELEKQAATARAELELEKLKLFSSAEAEKLKADLALREAQAAKKKFAEQQHAADLLRESEAKKFETEIEKKLLQARLEMEQERLLLQKEKADRLERESVSSFRSAKGSCEHIAVQTDPELLEPPGYGLKTVLESISGAAAVSSSLPVPSSSTATVAIGNVTGLVSSLSTVNTTVVATPTTSNIAQMAPGWSPQARTGGLHYSQAASIRQPRQLSVESPEFFPIVRPQGCCCGAALQLERQSAANTSAAGQTPSGADNFTYYTFEGPGTGRSQPAVAAAGDNRRPVVITTNNLAVIPEFDGETQTFADWVRRFERHLAAMEPDATDEKLARLFATKMTHSAEMFYENLDTVTRSKYRGDGGMKSAFETRYNLYKAGGIGRWTRIVQQQSESVETYFTRITRAHQRDMGSDAASDLAQKFLLSMFIQGLRSEYRRSMISDPPRDITAAVTRARQIEADREADSDRYRLPQIREDASEFLEAEVCDVRSPSPTAKRSQNSRSRQRWQANNRRSPRDQEREPSGSRSRERDSSGCRRDSDSRNTRTSDRRGDDRPRREEDKYRGRPDDEWVDGKPRCRRCQKVGHFARSCFANTEYDDTSHTANRASVGEITTRYCGARSPSHIGCSVMMESGPEILVDADTVECVGDFPQVLSVDAKNAEEVQASSGAASLQVVTVARDTPAAGNLHGYARTYVDLSVNRYPVTAMVDTGSIVTLIDESFARVVTKCDDWDLSPIELTSGSGHRMDITGTVDITVRLAGRNFRHPVMICRGFGAKLLLGDDFCKANGCNVLYEPKRGFTVKGVPVRVKTSLTSFGRVASEYEMSSGANYQNSTSRGHEIARGHMMLANFPKRLISGPRKQPPDAVRACVKPRIRDMRL